MHDLVSREFRLWLHIFHKLIRIRVFRVAVKRN